MIIHHGTTYYPNYNHQGSLISLIDENNNIVKKLRYSPYGNILYDSNSSLNIHKTFANGLYDEDTKLIRFGKRDYDPQTGTWTALDPIEFKGGDSNLYRYVFNDPVNFIDPRGEFWWFAIAGLLGGSVSYLNAPDVGEEAKSGMPPLAEATLTCTPIGSISKNLTIYGKAKRGGRILQLSWDNKPFFRIDKHNLNNSITKKGVSKPTLHYHRGFKKENMKKHRPYQGGW